MASVWFFFNFSANLTLSKEWNVIIFKVFDVSLHYYYYIFFHHGYTYFSYYVLFVLDHFINLGYTVFKNNKSISIHGIIESSYFYGRNLAIYLI